MEAVPQSTGQESDIPKPEIRDARKQIIAIAAEMFAVKGFSKVSIRDIARRADLSVSTVMYHAGSKESLLEHCLEATFSADERMADLIEFMGNTRPSTPEEFFSLYDRFVELAVAQVANYPMACRLWWRLLLDHEQLFHSLEEKLHRKLFVTCNSCLKNAQHDGLIRQEIRDLSFFVSSLDSMIDGFFVGGHIFADGNRTVPGDINYREDFVRWLKQYGRLVLSRTSSDPEAQ